MAWRAFNWGSRGPAYETDIPGVYIMAHEFYNNGVKVTFRGQNLTELQRVMHIFHVYTIATPTVTDCTNIGAIFANWWDTNYKNLVVADWLANDVVTTSMASVPGPQWDTTINLPGVRPGSSVPASVTLAIKLSTDSSGRRRHGRWYPWPASTGDVTRDHFSGSYVAQALAVTENLRGALGGAGYFLGVYSAVDNVIYPYMRSEATDTVVDAQRRRLPGRGQ